MPETKKQIEIFGHPLDVSDVPVLEAKEDFVQYKLEDGTVLKVKAVASAVLRVENQFLPDGSPVYLVALNPVVSVVSSPLKRETAAHPETKKVN